MTGPDSRENEAAHAPAALPPFGGIVGAEMQTTIAGAVWPALPSPFAMNILSLLFQFEYSQWLPAEELRANQFRQLDLLLRHAVETVPHYRETLLGAGYRPGTPLDAETWSRLPVLERRTLQEKGPALRASSYPKEHGAAAEHRSSGSTGMPIAVTKTDLCDLLWEVETLRDHVWHRRDLSGSLAAIRPRTRPEEDRPDGIETNMWNAGINAVYRTGPGMLFSGSRPLSEQIAWLQRKQPVYLQTNPSCLRELLRAFDSRGERLERLKGVITYSELVPPGLREETQRVLGVPLRDIYSCREIGYIALECPDHPHYHVQGEIVMVEVLDAQNRPCRPGETGRVVVTPLHNFATPLIRYALGDHAEAGAPCPCGRGLPVLSRILGRTRNMFRLPGGDGKWLDLAPLEKRLDLPIRQYQLVQTAYGAVEARIVPLRPWTADEEAALRAVVTGPVGAAGCTVSIAYRDALPRLASGKFEDFISEVA